MNKYIVLIPEKIPCTVAADFYTRSDNFVIFYRYQDGGKSSYQVATFVLNNIIGFYKDEESEDNI